jgi:ABC-type antimicrobial peptide transport system permease subunit
MLLYGLKKGESQILLGLLDFAKKAFKHRKIQPAITLLGLVICVASTIFLILLGQSLGLIFAQSTGTRFVNFLSSTISQFIYFDTALIFLVGMVVIYFLFTSMMADRQKDVGLIKALGSKENLGFGYVMAEPLLIIIYGCIGGGLIGSITFIVYSAVFLPNALLSQGLICFFLFLGFLVVSFLCSWIISSRKAEDFFKNTPVSLFAGDTQNFDFVKEDLIGLKKFLNRLPWSLQIVLKGIIRSRSKSKTALVCLTLCIFLMTVSLAGGVVAWWTTRNYVDNSFGQNVLAVGNEKVLAEYETMMTDALNIHLSSFNFIDGQFFIDNSFLEKLNTISQIEIVDSRLLLIDKVVEVQTSELVTDDDGSHYVTYGRSNVRSSNALIVGINAHYVADNLLTQNMLLNSNTTIIGSSLAQSIFDNPLKQKIAIDSTDSHREFFLISDVVLDPINQGFVVYVSIDALQELTSLTTQNLVLIKIQDNTVVSEIERLAEQYGLMTLSLDRVHQLSLSNIDRIWISILPFPILSVITTLIGLLNCLLVSFSGRQHDFGILRAIGAKSNYTAKLVLIESFVFILPTATLGIIFGMMFNFIFLIPNATINPQLLLSCVGGLFILLLSLCLISAMVVLRLNKQLPTKLIQITK